MKRQRERTVTKRLKSGLLSFIHLKCKRREADSEHARLSPPLSSSLICIQRAAGFVRTLRLMNFMAVWALEPVRTPRHWCAEELWAKANSPRCPHSHGGHGCSQYISGCGASHGISHAKCLAACWCLLAYWVYMCSTVWDNWRPAAWNKAVVSNIVIYSSLTLQ